MRLRHCWIAGVTALLTAAGGKPSAVATFESLGIYYDRESAGGGCSVQYRLAGGKWQPGYPLVHDEREEQNRGSLVGLKPDTPYDVRLEAGGDRVEFQARTLSENIPVGRTTFLPGGSAGHLVVQRNLIAYPRGGANDWESGRPSGPQAVSLIDSRGGNVIRHNTIRSTEDHGFNDGIGGASNYSFKGSPNRDSDIYGNIVANCWDDAIESEGANMNVRIWSNYIHRTFVHVATAATSRGPLYIFRNVFGKSRVSHQDSSGGMMIKTGMNYVEISGKQASTGLGARFIFHNTASQPDGALDVFSSHELNNAVSRDNIFYSRGRTSPRERGAPPNDFRNDLTGGYLGGGFVRSLFLPSEGLEWFLAPTMNLIQWGRVPFQQGGREFAITDPMVPVKNPAIDAGVRLPGFNDLYTEEAPDIGAFENGREPLRFGREMAPGFAHAPWERHSCMSRGVLRARGQTRYKKSGSCSGSGKT